MNEISDTGGMPEKFLRRPEVIELTGIPQTTLYTMMERGDFPRPVQLSPRFVGWRASEVAAWQQARIAERDAKRAA